jgi:hypothetical protein
MTMLTAIRPLFDHMEWARCRLSALRRVVTNQRPSKPFNIDHARRSAQITDNAPAAQTTRGAQINVRVSPAA